MSRIVDNCEACDPVQNFTQFLEKNGLKVEDQKLADYHFKELYFRLSGTISKIPKFDNINMVNKTKYVCECHWTTVELDT